MWFNLFDLNYLAEKRNVDDYVGLDYIRLCRMYYSIISLIDNTQVVHS
jgi:hypothetical protein